MAPSMHLPGNGGCLCGAVRYALVARPTLAGYCHCSICRRASGAPVQMFATVPRAAFRFVRGTPRCYRSTPFGRRWFCGECGSPLCMQVDHEPDTTDVAVATMDEAGAVAPRFHIWHEARLPWFETADALPRHARARPASSD